MAEQLIYEDAERRIWREERPGAVTTRYEAKPGSAAANGRAQDDQLDQALAALRTYRDQASPTNAQTTAVVKLLCRVAITLIRQRRDLLDGVD